MEAALSIIIKTFQRPDSLRRLLDSIREAGLRYPVIVADDGQESVKDMLDTDYQDLPIQYLRLAFDTGLSEGRNQLVKAVRSPYFILCDDDYAFDQRADFERALTVMQYNQIDILGGAYYNYVNIPNFAVFIRQLTHPFRLTRYFLNQYQVSRYIGTFKVKETSCELIISNQEPAGEFVTCDLVNNFFIADTKKVLAMGGWDKQLKMGEHEDFFLRAKNAGLKVAFLKNFGTKHYPAIPVKNSLYAAYRKRAADYKKLFAKKHGFEVYTEKQQESGKLLFTIDTK